MSKYDEDSSKLFIGLLQKEKKKVIHKIKSTLYMIALVESRAN